MKSNVDAREIVRSGVITVFVAVIWQLVLLTLGAFDRGDILPSVIIGFLFHLLLQAVQSDLAHKRVWRKQDEG